MSTQENAGVAFALVLGAAASTGLGAAVVFFPSVVKLASQRVLAASLGFSAGVMMYVSFIEIFGKATLSFMHAGHDENFAYIYSTCCFFGGVVCMILLNVAVHSLLGLHHHHHHHHHHDDPNKHHHQHDDQTPKKVSSRESVNQKLEEEGPTAPCCSSDPVHQLETFQRMASVLEHEHEHEHHDHVAREQESEVAILANELDSGDDNSQSDQQEEKSRDSSRKRLDFDGDDKAKDDKQDDKTAAASDMLDENSEAKKKLQKMGLNTALAIGLHNFPEGLATFVAALSDPAVGTVLAVAIAIHNIPEGLCVALPIYYATGNRLKAFLWAVLSGASEVVAALLGWLILASVVTDSAYAILFGLVSGMMVIISTKELLPTAHQYDPQDTVVTYSFIAGMALMALSLVLFKL